MNKNMKLILVVLTILILAVIIIAGVKFITKPEYTAEEALNLIDPKISDNMYLKIETHTTIKDDENIIPDSTEEFYIKDKKGYKKFSTPDEIMQEFFFDFENNEQRNVFHYKKEINFFEMNSLNNPSEIISSSLDFHKNNLEDAKDTYEYCGKEIIDGKKCIKVSVQYEEDKFLEINEKSKSYFYIDIENKSIIKEDIYIINGNELELLGTITVTYLYDTVQDDDILKFDSNNYPGYTIDDVLTTGDADDYRDTDK